MANAQGLQPISLTELNDPYPGYIYYSQSGVDTVSPVDNSKVFFRKRISNRALGFYISPRGELANFAIDLDGFLMRTADMNVVDTVFCPRNFRADYHVFMRLKNGNLLLSAIEERVVDMTPFTPQGLPGAKVDGSVLLEINAQDSVVWSWNSFDYVPITDATEDIDLTQRTIDYFHINSVLEWSDTTLLLSARNNDVIYKIHKKTGQILWRLGGAGAKHNDFRFLNDTTQGRIGFSHQHSISISNAGNLLMFDNGNLRMPRYSRAVEYKINETAKTIEKVWQYLYPDSTYSHAMGSVQQLSDDRFFIGWGIGKHTLTATEVSRNGTLHTELRNVSGLPIQAYNALKSTVGMVGVRKYIATTGTYNFNVGDSTSLISCSVSSAVQPCTLTVERHHYAPHNLEYSGTSPCFVLSHRWVIRSNTNTTPSGKTFFAVSGLSTAGVAIRKEVQLFWRAKEGEGAFARLNTTFTPDSLSLILDNITSGEYMLGYYPCTITSIIYPTDATNQIDSMVTIRWNQTYQNAGYDVEITRLSGNMVVTTRSTMDTTIVAHLSPNTKYSIRVRGKGTHGVFPWSTSITFRTALPVPIPISPVSPNNSLTVNQMVRFVWRPLATIDTYRFRLNKTTGDVAVLDTLVSDTVFSYRFNISENFYWTVQAVSDSLQSTPSLANHFVTKPTTVTLVSPSPNELDIAVEECALVWQREDLAERYAVFVVLANDTLTTVFADTTADTTILVSNLPSNNVLSWYVRALSRVSQSDKSEIRNFTTSTTPTLGRPIIIAPENLSNVSSNVTLVEWLPVQGATSYVVQITDSSFKAPIFQTTVVDTQVTTPLLPNGVYVVRVKALENAGTSSWSAVHKFKVRVVNAQPLTPTYPYENDTVVDQNLVFEFRGDEKYSDYIVQISRANDFSTISYQFDIPDTSVFVSTLNNATAYYWRVFGKHNLGIDTGLVIKFFCENPQSTVTFYQQKDLCVYFSNKKLLLKSSDLSEDCISSVECIGVNGIVEKFFGYSCGSVCIPENTINLTSGLYLCRVRHISGKLIYAKLVVFD